MEPDYVRWHFDAGNRILRIAFVGRASVLVVTYRLCPRCGVTMEERPGGWRCALCGPVFSSQGERML